MRRLLCLALLTCVACETGGAGQLVPLLDYQATVPAGWQAHPPTSSMRLVQYLVPRASGTPAEVVVFYFGVDQGGSADANIARWTGQFSGEDGGAVTPRVMTVEGTAFTTTVAELEGTYARGIGMGSDAEPIPGQALVAAVVETPSGNLFLQLFGDREAVAAARDDFLGMVTSIREGSGASA